MTQDDINQLIEHLRDQAEKCAYEPDAPTHRTGYGNGVSAGLNYAADGLEEILRSEESE